MIFILKKLEDDIINFENLLFNLDHDSEFIQNEILSYLSNPERKVVNEITFKPEIEISEAGYNSKPLTEKERSDNEKETERIDELKEELTEESETDKTEEKEFRKNYLELIQTDEDDSGIVYELPGIENKEPYELEFANPEMDLPGEDFSGDQKGFNIKEEAGNITGKKSEYETEGELINPEEEISGHGENDISTDTDEINDLNEEENASGIILKEELYTDPESGIIDNLGNLKKDNQSGPAESDKLSELNDSLASKASKDSKDSEESEESNLGDNIQLSDEIQEELDLFDEYGEPDEEDEDGDISDTSEEEFIKEIVKAEPEPANTLFVEYESEIRDRNRYLNLEFENMIKLLAEKSKDEEERSKIILSIIETSKHLEDLSRKMSLEVISNIYQTITLSFEKISEAKYDITESTLNLFRKGLTLVLSLINGDNYFGYKDILKSIENIRNTLIEEKEKRETYLKRLQEKLELEKNLDKRFPDETAKNKISLLKKYIKDTENNFNSLDEISGEYQIYEALRSLSGSLNNFKDIVKVSKELKMMKLVQLSEAGYIFVKFLQNYRINPVTEETKEIFGYIIHNLKLLTMGRDTEDIDLFISYLNDPVKIFSNTEKKKT